MLWYYNRCNIAIRKVMHLTSKRNWCIIGALFIIAGSLLLILNPTSVALVTFGGLLRGIGMTPILGMIFTMIADSIEYGQWKTGLRTAGAIQSATTSGQKFGQGIGSALIGFIMQEMDIMVIWQSRVHIYYRRFQICLFMGLQF